MNCLFLKTCRHEKNHHSPNIFETLTKYQINRITLRQSKIARKKVLMSHSRSNVVRFFQTVLVSENKLLFTLPLFCTADFFLSSVKKLFPPKKKRTLVTRSTGAVELTEKGIPSCSAPIVVKRESSAEE